jgi:PPP family 3-phenylpropionic acid transporter
MSRTSLALRLSAYLGAIYLMLGAQLPFWSVFLEGKGLNPSEIGIALAVTSWARVVGLPLFGAIADPPGRGRPTLLGLALAGAAIYAAYFFAEGFAWALALQVLIGFFTSALIPLGDSQVLEAARDRGIDYGRIRLVGSVTFILGNVMGGWLIALGNRDWYLAGLVLPLLATAAAAWALPRRPLDRAPRAPISIGSLFRNRAYIAIVVISSFIQCSHGAYYVVSALDWRATGYSEATIAWLWVEGVVAEILLLAAAKHLLRRMSAVQMLALGGFAAIARWSVTALSHDLGLLIAVQALHAFSFAIVHLATVTTIARVVPPERLASAQVLVIAVYAGPFVSVSMALAGWLYDIDGGMAAYLAMVAFATAGLATLLWMRRWLAPQPVP